MPGRLHDRRRPLRPAQARCCYRAGRDRPGIRSAAFPGRPHANRVGRHGSWCYDSAGAKRHAGSKGKRASVLAPAYELGSYLRSHSACAARRGGPSSQRKPRGWGRRVGLRHLRQRPRQLGTSVRRRAGGHARLQTSLRAQWCREAVCSRAQHGIRQHHGIRHCLDPVAGCR